jgi:hypothetical protein
VEESNGNGAGLSSFTWNEWTLAITSTVWGMWVLYYVFTMPYTPVRLFFAVITLSLGLVLIAVNVQRVHNYLRTLHWGKYPASVRVRWFVHFFMAWAWMLTALAIALGTTTRPIHCVPYLALGVLHIGKMIRLENYDA